MLSTTLSGALPVTSLSACAWRCAVVSVAARDFCSCAPSEREPAISCRVSLRSARTAAKNRPAGSAASCTFVANDRTWTAS